MAKWLAVASNDVKSQLAEIADLECGLNAAQSLLQAAGYKQSFQTEESRLRGFLELDLSDIPNASLLRQSSVDALRDLERTRIELARAQTLLDSARHRANGLPIRLATEGYAVKPPPHYDRHFSPGEVIAAFRDEKPDLFAEVEMTNWHRISAQSTVLVTIDGLGEYSAEMSYVTPAELISIERRVQLDTRKYVLVRLQLDGGPEVPHLAEARVTIRSRP